MENLFDNDSVYEGGEYIQPAERVENCYLKDIEKMEDSSVVFHFVQMKNGAQLKLDQRIFCPTPRQNDTPENIKKKAALAVTQIKHIFGAFLTADQLSGISAAPKSLQEKDIIVAWREYLGKMMKALKEHAPNFTEIEVALKVTLRQGSDGKYYATLPLIPNFISSEMNPKAFRTDPQYDRYERPNADASAASSSPVEIEEADEVEEEDDIQEVW